MMVTLNPRSLVSVLALQAAIGFAASQGAAYAQNFPNRPLTMVAPFAPGGTTDAIARIIADGMGVELGQPVVVENVGGAGGMMGANRVAKAPPDGYQFVLGSLGTHAQNQSFYKKPLYNAATDFEPVVLVTDQSIVLVARKDFPGDNLQQFIAYAKANQSRMSFGSAGIGGSNHLACLLLNTAIGINVTHVPYRSGAQAMQDLLAGRIDYQCPTGAVAVPQITGHTVKALAILSKERSPILPMLASAHEQGLTDFDIPTLVCDLPAQRYTEADRAEASRRGGRNNGKAFRSTTPQTDRCRGRRARTSIDGISGQIRRR
jgi:tripartite-type tricarboxylate transporter receptor subunit TctC